MKKINSLLIVSLLSTGVYANIDIKSLDIYKNRTFVNQELDLSKNSVDLIGTVRFEDIRFIKNSNCSISNVEVIPNNYSNDSLSLEIKSYAQKIAFKKNEIASINKTSEFLTNIKFEKDAVNLKNIKDVSSYARLQILENSNLVYTLQKELQELYEKQKELTNKKSSNSFSKLNYDASCKTQGNVKVTYPIYNVLQNGFYEIDVDSKNSNINIKNKSFLTQSSGYDFNNIDINMYTYNYSNTINPQTFRPEYLDIIKKPQISYSEVSSVQMDMQPRKERLMKSKSLASGPSFSYNETSIKAFFKASNISLLSGVKNSVTFSNDKYKTTNKIEIDGFSSSKAFYKVDFKSTKLYSNKLTKLYLDSNYIGNSYSGEIKKDKKSSIYLGVDSFVDIKKDLVKDMKEEPFFSVSKLKTEKLWKYTITNNSNITKKITVIERLPISKHEDIKIELNLKTKYTRKEDNGKISYDITLKANEKISFDYGYTIEKPYKK